MTTNNKDITELVYLHCSSIHFTELDRLLKKLDHEDLDVLRAMLEEVYLRGEDDLCTNLQMKYQNGLDVGYQDGYNDGYSVGRRGW